MHCDLSRLQICCSLVRDRYIFATHSPHPELVPLSAQCSCPSSPYGSDQMVHGQRGLPSVVFACSTPILRDEVQTLSISQSSSKTCSTPNPVSLTQEMLYSTYRVWFCETQMTGWERCETLLPRDK
ncbi:hypothetical protein M404DRAFT_1008082 [Pisolithus tinctorius Marx 270]|uniref:Uncharacterized protein n=1 Tax=Pisolithus tinctorius Marx 270 TaxID=870435 RepID=A0A0C3ICE5_PISTI|nr:hypothetical protein M404DRAFT_1008082 [Pisolithus tinctorius Marx 270]